MEFVWRPMNESLGESAQIFAHTLYNHYSAPNGFDFDTLNDNYSAFIDDPSLDTYNAPQMAAKLHDWITTQASHYRANNLFVPMGDDFRFQNAHQYFRSSDKLINYFNENVGLENNIELIYSTPSMYVDAIAAEKIEWPTKYDDLFPYADNENSYWTGYFSSRANDKGYMRRASQTLHSSNKLFALASIDQAISDDQIEAMIEAKETMLDVVGVI